MATGEWGSANPMQSNHLVVNDAQRRVAAHRSVSAIRTDVENVLVLTFEDADAREDLDSLQRRFGVGPSGIGVITADPRASAIPSAPVPSSIAGWRTRVDPLDQSALVTAVQTYLDERVTDESSVALYVDSLDELLENVTFEDATAVLRALTDKVDEAEAVGYYRVGSDFDQGTVDVLAPLFDSVVDSSQGDSTAHQRSVSSTGLGFLGGVRPGPSDWETYVDDAREHTSWLWLLSVTTFGFGDILTTIVGLQMSVVVETSPVAARIIGANGLGFIYVVKLATFVLFYLLWRFAPSPHRIGIPLGLCLLGIGVNVWNAGVIASALFGV